MKQRPRIYYSDSQKALMWERWKQGFTLHEIGKIFDRPHTSIHRILAETGGFRPVQRSRASTALTLQNARKSPGRWSLANRFDQLPPGLGKRRRRSVEKSSAMAAPSATVQTRPTKRPGIVRDARSVASCVRTAHWPASWRASCGCSGLRNKSQAGSSILIRATKAITCHTRPSTAVCSFKRVAL